MAHRRILVVKLSALGDFVLATGCFAAIRAHHPDAEITLLTGAPLAELASKAPYFDYVAIDSRPRAFDPAGWWRVRRWLRSHHFDRIYDLQTSDRTGFYFRLMGPGKRPEWSGIARGCSHPHDNPRRDFMHILDARAEQLRIAGIEHVPPPDLSWAAVAMPDIVLPPRFILLMPGSSPHRAMKRWPIDRFGALAKMAEDRGLTSLVLGGVAETPLAQAIKRQAPSAIDLTGRTTINHLVWLGQRARRAIGNDTGPTHIVLIAGAPTTLLLSQHTHPSLRTPRWPEQAVLFKPDIADLSVAEVAATLPMG